MSRPRPLPRLTRRARRRLFVIGVLALGAALLPLWAPALLATLPAFRVQRIEVVGTRYLGPDEVVRLAAVDSTASVWDDPGRWERRIRSHPLVEEARVHRRGLSAIEIRVVEDRPVALLATPALLPVSAVGRLLPLDPAEAALDLPLIPGGAKVEEGRIADPETLRLTDLLGRLEEYDPGFASQISQIRLVAGGDVEIRLLESAHCERILLPGEDPLAGLRRVEAALAAAGERAREADARFAGQVVLR